MNSTNYTYPGSAVQNWYKNSRRSSEQTDSALANDRHQSSSPFRRVADREYTDDRSCFRKCLSRQEMMTCRGRYRHERPLQSTSVVGRRSARTNYANCFFALCAARDIIGNTSPGETSDAPKHDPARPSAEPTYPYRKGCQCTRCPVPGLRGQWHF